MYIISMRTKNSDQAVIDIATATAKELLAMANILEESELVVSFAVNNGLQQTDFGCGNFTKWVTQNYPTITKLINSVRCETQLS